MTMISLPPSAARRVRPRAAVNCLRVLGACALGLAAALLVSCGSSGRGLIPASAAGPLKADFEAVQQTAESANGDCTATEAALTKTDEDFAALPRALDAGLASNLRQGIENLHTRAHELCVQPSAGSTSTTTTPAKTSTTPPSTGTTSGTSTTPTTPTTTSTTTTTPATPGPGGGTAAPGETPAGGEQGGAESEASGAGGGVGAGGQEAGK